jgi:hypothetical protein
MEDTRKRDENLVGHGMTIALVRKRKGSGLTIQQSRKKPISSSEGSERRGGSVARFSIRIGAKAVNSYQRRTGSNCHKEEIKVHRLLWPFEGPVRWPFENGKGIQKAAPEVVEMNFPR